MRSEQPLYNKRLFSDIIDKSTHFKEGLGLDKQKYLLDEVKRIEDLKRYEYEAYNNGFRYIAGIDEAGRGPIAGPVMAAAVILSRDFFCPGINDSKKLTALKRSKLAAEIKKQAITWSVAAVFPSYLDKVNILNATREAMLLAVKNLSPRPEFLLIDAVQLPDIDIKQYPLIKGDSLSVSIAAASILAKVERDRVMEAFDSLYPGYGFSKHKGYATREHLQSLLRLGTCALHRVSFEPVKSMVLGARYGEQPALFE